MCINYIKKDIIIVKGKILGIILSINFKSIINYWAKILEELNIFYKFIRKGIVIIIVTIIVIMGLTAAILLLLIISMNIFI